ncbi:MAG: ABC-F family ATP-binding cassette domain-containing protein [bacterium]
MIKINNIYYNIAGREILNNISLTLDLGEKVALIGENGVGKSTLLRIIAGELEANSGEIVKDKEQSICYFPQEIPANYKGSVLEYLKLRIGDIEEFQRLKVFDSTGIREISLDREVGTLSGGEKTKLLLATIMLAGSDILLLDEPTNNLDKEGLILLEEYLLNNKKAVIFVSHDRTFIRKLSTKVLELSANATGLATYNMSYDDYLNEKHLEKEKIKSDYENYLEDKKRAEKAYREMQRNATKSNNSKNKKDNDKLAFNREKESATRKLGRQTEVLRNRIGRMDDKSKPQKELDLNFLFDNHEYLGDSIAKLDKVEINLSKERKIGPLTLEVNRGDRIAIVGANGVGKTTLLKILLKELKPTSGDISIGPSVHFGLIDQDQSIPAPDKSLLDNFKIMTGLEADKSSLTEGKLRQVLARFNLDEKNNIVAEKMSPGERQRLILASLSWKGANVLLFDEPTNHLDIAAAEELQSAINKYSGTYIVITHDREFLEAIKPSKVLEITHDGIQTV